MTSVCSEVGGGFGPRRGVWVRRGGNVMENGGWVILARVCARQSPVV